MVLVLKKSEYECSMCKLEMMIEGEREKRMEIDEKVNVLVTELERERKQM